MPYKYANKKYEPEHMAKAVGTSLSISTKHAIEICTLLRCKELSYAKELLKKAIEKKQAIPFTRFNKDVGHKPGIGPGRYPKKASGEILKLLECVEANAQFKGLNTSELVINHICAHKAGKAMRYGRQRGRTSKRTHVEVMVKETAKKKAEEKGKEAKPKETKKAEKKPTEKPKEVKKPEVPNEAKPEKRKEEAKPKQEDKK
ncbi:50S ribosomal protein L22 [Candidatus Woesearchaeota archaeon]|nr:50S ribosomal protein L22 [Candidatus Woesearchaeota archaeon]